MIGLDLGPEDGILSRAQRRLMHLCSCSRHLRLGATTCLSRRDPHIALGKRKGDEHAADSSILFSLTGCPSLAFFSHNNSSWKAIKLHLVTLVKHFIHFGSILLYINEKTLFILVSLDAKLFHGSCSCLKRFNLRLELTCAVHDPGPLPWQTD